MRLRDINWFKIKSLDVKQIGGGAVVRAGCKTEAGYVPLDERDQFQHISAMNVVFCILEAQNTACPKGPDNHF